MLGQKGAAAAGPETAAAVDTEVVRARLRKMQARQPDDVIKDILITPGA